MMRNPEIDHGNHHWRSGRRQNWGLLAAATGIAGAAEKCLLSILSDRARLLSRVNRGNKPIAQTDSISSACGSNHRRAAFISRSGPVERQSKCGTAQIFPMLRESLTIRKAKRTVEAVGRSAGRLRRALDAHQADDSRCDQWPKLLEDVRFWRSSYCGLRKKPAQHSAFSLQLPAFSLQGTGTRDARVP